MGARPDVAPVPAYTFGLDGILRNIDLNAREQTDEIEDALQDLNNLMLKAKDMVALAQSLNAKLPPPAAVGLDEDASETTTIRSSLVSLGLPTPAVTPDMVRSDREYAQELARELAGVLTGQGLQNGKASAHKPLMSDSEDGRGLMSLDEVWCIWNRARGICEFALSSSC